MERVSPRAFCMLLVLLPLLQRANSVSFCTILTKERRADNPMADPANPTELLKTCHAPTFKAYLDWRCRNSRIKKISSIMTYWKVLSMLYSDKFLSWIDGKVLFDIGNVSALYPRLNLKPV